MITAAPETPPFRVHDHYISIDLIDDRTAGGVRPDLLDRPPILTAVFTAAEQPPGSGKRQDRSINSYRNVRNAHRFKEILRLENGSTDQLSCGHCVNTLDLKPGADHRVLCLSRTVLDIGRGDDRAVGKDFHTRITTVGAGIAMQQFDSVLPRPPVFNILIRAYPGHEMPGSRTLWRPVSKSNNQSSILCVDASMPVTRQSPGGIHRLTPSRGFIPAEHHQAPAFVRILTHQTAQLVSIRRAEHIRFTRQLTFHLGD